MTSNNDDLRKDAAEALCCLAHALGEDFTIFIPSIRKILVKHHLRVCYLFFFCFENTRAGYHFIKKRNIVQRGEQKHPTHPLKSLISCLYHFGCLCNYSCHFLQYRKWDEIENRLLRRELLITENLSVQKYTQCPPDVISDPLDDCDGTPSEIADETQRQARSHQVICLAFYS